MAGRIYRKGDTINLRATIRDRSTHQLLDPSTLILYYAFNDAGPQTAEYPAAITRVSTGVYSIGVMASEPGKMTYYFQSTLIGAATSKPRTVFIQDLPF